MSWLEKKLLKTQGTSIVEVTSHSIVYFLNFHGGRGSCAEKINRLKEKHVIVTQVSVRKIYFLCIYSLCPRTSNDAELVTCTSQQLTKWTFLSKGSLNMSRVGVIFGFHLISWWQHLCLLFSSPARSYFTTVTTCFSFSDTTGTDPGLLCLRTFLSLENKNRGWAMNDSICWWEYSGWIERRGRERSANRKEEETEYETVDLTPTSQATLMYPENNS